jgi:serine/threonine protein kinase
VGGIAPTSSGSSETSAMGTLAYMSPEQARGELSRLGRRSDVYNELRDRLFKSASDVYGETGALLSKETDVASWRPWCKMRPSGRWNACAWRWTPYRPKRKASRCSTSATVDDDALPNFRPSRWMDIERTWSVKITLALVRPASWAGI